MALMKQATQSSGKAKSLAPVLDAGGYAARIVQIIDLGNQPPQAGSEFQKNQYKLLMKFECLDEFMVEQDEAGEAIMEQDPDGEPGEMIPKFLKDKPRWFDFEFTYNPDGYMSEKGHLFKLVTAIDGFEVKPCEAFPEGKPAKDLVNWLGEPLMINLSAQVATKGKHAGKQVNRIAGFAAMKSKDKKVAAPLVNPTLIFDMGEPDLEVFGKLPSGNVYCPQEKIKASVGFEQSKLAELLGLAKAGPVENKASQAEIDEAMKAEAAAQAAAKAEREAAGETDSDDPF